MVLGTIYETETDMEEFRWMILALLFYSAAAQAQAQTGFLNLDCGARVNSTDPKTNLTWGIDSKEYINVGEQANVSNTSLDFYLQSLRYFSKPYDKSCYSLPVVPNTPYMLRLWFHFGNYNGNTNPPSFNVSVETQGMLYRQMENIAVAGTPNWDTEKILTTGSAERLYVCFIRTLDGSDNDPFVSAIQLRKLLNGMYDLQDKGLMLNSVLRFDLGGESLIRYKGDDFDRFWQVNSTEDLYNRGLVVTSSTEAEISSDNSSSNYPPSKVMQTAIVAKENVSRLFLNLTAVKKKTLIALYFGEIESVNTSQSRIFNVTINGQPHGTVNFSMDSYVIGKKIKLPSTQARELVISLNSIKGQGNSSRGPLINALEQYNIMDTEPETSADDVSALLNMNKEFGISDWISDPCFSIEWSGIKCDKGNPVRVLEIDLNGRNLPGSLKDVCNLTRLEKLNLQNNRLSGSIPPCLSNFSNLRELDIRDNNFSGKIPAELFHRNLIFRYSGNQFLVLPKGKNKGPMIAAIIGGILAVLLVLISMLVYRKRQSAKPDNRSIKVPNPVRSRSFSVAELRTATQDFSEEIGQGGFGTVFYGKLVDGNEIAVKVLSSSSKQGVDEFLNEIDLLSRVNHTNLVCLLGYCDSSKELMLVYEYMGGRSLRDHLYGSLAYPSTLDWKARIRVALDAAEGLEYLHWRATPKIIHRDVKSSNILLDLNMRAKVADFGLSRILRDDAISHVTTTVKGTMGYMDPEYFGTNKLTEKSDVFSFGVVLLEIICGRRPIEDVECDDEVNLVRWVMLHTEADQDPPRHLIDIIDKRLVLGENEMECFNCVVNLALKCVEREGYKRPSMNEVVAGIKEAMLYIEPKDISSGTSVDAPSSEAYSVADYSSSLLHLGR
ncbi:probable LRR receptor-like serine/threonine-protein kinase At1g67720 [Cryptomeria japonica]|uniref:probable LRR receptor-like serine/threonine-protein kinase At1g67720 n=1 Tax=Cryptomeria japonica TaxID=3369 RepID=UPI0027DA14DC|nr:probable LRR receptor-like serine/threonine-protein kinase At1g67720 [Cryptomeria japonica]